MWGVGRDRGGRVTDGSREWHGSVTGVPRFRHGCVTCDRDAGEVTPLRAFFRRCNHVTTLWPPHRGPNTRSAFRGPDFGLLGAGKCDVPGIFVNSRLSLAANPREPVTEDRTSSRPVTNPVLRAEPLASSLKDPHVPGASWRPQPARAATRRPGLISDGRDGPGPSPVPSPSQPKRGQPSLPRPRTHLGERCGGSRLRRMVTTRATESSPSTGWM